MKPFLNFCWNTFGYEVFKVIKRFISFCYHYTGGSVAEMMNDNKWYIQKHHYIFNIHIYTSRYKSNKPLVKCSWYDRS